MIAEIKVNEIVVGSVVAFKDTKGDREKSGYYRVTSLRGGKVNLGSVFGKGIYFKSILVEEVYECQEEWYAKWSQSESYMCM
jgi:hypothetical protein